MNKKVKNINWFQIQIHLIVFSICVFLASFMVFDGAIDYDVLWHLKQGEVYLEHGVNTNDYLSWQSGLTWTTAEWLYEVLIYLITKYTGAIGFTVLLALSTYQIYGWALKKNGTSHPFIFLIVLGITFMFPKNIYNRPGEFQILFATIVIYWALYDRNKLWLKQIIAGLFLANFHGGQVVTLLATLGIIDFVTLIHLIVVDDSFIKENDKKILKEITSQIVLMFLASLINPMGIEMYTVGMKVPKMYSTQFIDEWQTWNIGIASGILILLTIIAIQTSQRFRKFNWRTLNILAIISAYTILSIRTQRLAGYLQAFIILFGYNYIIEFYEWVQIKVAQQRVNSLRLQLSREKPSDAKDAEWELYKDALNARLDKMLNKLTATRIISDTQEVQTNTVGRAETPTKSKMIYTIIYIGIILFDILWVNAQAVDVKTFGDLVDKNTEFQIEIVEYLKDNNINDKLFCGYTTGGWLIWNDVKQFIDSRQQPFTEEISGNTQLDDTLYAVRGNDVYGDMTELFDKYDIDYVLWDSAELGCDISDKLVDSGEWEILVKASDTEQAEYLLGRVKA